MKLFLRYSLLFSALLMFFSIKTSAQNNSAQTWAKSFGYQKAFIENRGQFSIPASFGNPEPVLFAVDHGGTKIFFTKKGITYTLLEASKKQKDAREMERERREEFNNPEEFARHEREEHQLKTKTDQVTMLWQNANNNVKVEASGLTSDYHNYSYKDESGNIKNLSYIKSYKKITYKNLYPNIDIEYVFAEKDGLKYSLILHPGADPSQVKMLYDSHVSLKDNGEIHISTRFGDIVDHAPLSFYQQNSSAVIASSFLKSGKTVSFQLNNYDNTKTVVIDPWTQTPAFASNWDCVWECEKDGAGNVYIIGGVTPMQLLKYNSAGTLQWTYNTPYDTSAWLGTFAVDDVGNSYVTQGSVAKMVKVSTAGAVLWNNANPGGIFGLTEFWCITFNCDQTRLIVGGTGGSGLTPLPYIYEMNMSNGNVLSSLQVTPGNLFPTQEVRAIAPCGNGRYYFLTHDSIGYINQSFSSCSTPSSAIYKATNNYGLSYKCENWRYDNTGIMAIKANTSFVYVNRGNRLDKRNLATGAIIASVTIPGGNFASGGVQNSGIDLDDCGNIYVGSKNAVYKFDANLNQLASYATTYNVYDVHVTTGGNIIACGSTGTSGTNSRTGTIQYISAGACNTLSLTCCDANICKPPLKCITDPAFNLTAATAGGTWSGTGITNATNGTFNPATAGAGTHIITYSLACGSGTTSITVSMCNLAVCNNGAGFTVTGGSGPYNWQSGSGGSAGGGWSWTTYATNTISVGTPTSYPIRVVDGTGATYSVSSATAVPNCSVTTCPTLTMSITSQTNVNCFATSTGSASISTTGGTGPYTYTWSPGNLSGASQTGLAAGIYTISIKDANLCTGSGTVTITQPTAAVSAVISATTVTGCGTSTGGATVTASGGTPGYTYSWTPSGGTTATVSNLGAGNNTVKVTDAKGCTVTAVANITTASGPTLSVTSQTNVNCFGTSTGTATVNAGGGSGPYTYTWTPGNLLGASQTSLAAGTYTINVSDANSCTGTGTLTITQPTSAVSAVISATTTTGCGVSTGGATVTAGGGTPGYTYSWTPVGGSTANGSNLGSGNNTVTVTDANGCVTSAIAVITSANGPILSVISTSDVKCFGANTGTATVAGSGSTGPYSYTWTPGNLVGASQTSLTAGTYTINVTDANLCSGSGVLTITQPTLLTAAITGTSATSCGLSTGTASVTANGGTPGYTYSWSPSAETSANASNLPSGNNTVTVTDGNGCTTTAVANIPSVGGPTLAILSTLDINCFGASTGTATVAGGGGTSPYTYTWTPGNLSGASQTGLAAGTYTIDFSDVNACAGTNTLTISQPTSAVSAVITGTSSTNCGLSTGTASVTANGGNPGYTYSWSPSGETSANAGSLPAGNNTVTVTDGNGCTVTAVANISSVGGPTLAILSTLDVNCFGASTGTATVAGGGGTGPYTYTWTPGNLSGASQTGLVAGTYTIDFSDVSACAGTNTLTISQPTSAVSAVITATSATGCGANSTGGATVSANGGTPGYTYSWVPSGGTTATVSNLGAGNNTVIVTDSKGCIATVIANIPVASVADVNITPSSTIIPCSTGTVSLSANSTTGGPYTYVWIPGTPSYTGTPYVVSNPGTYTVVALNTANGCTATATQVITKETITASFDASPYQGLMPLVVTFTNTSSNPSGTDYTWDFGNNTSLASNTSTLSTIYNTQGTFPVVLTANYGTCQDTAIKYIKVDLQSVLVVPNVFTPNGDGKNDVFTLDAVNIGEINLIIYDRWGLKMFEATSSGNCRWDGKTTNGSFVPDGTYFYIIKATGLDGENYDLKGHINIFK